MEPVEIAAGKYQLRPWNMQDVEAARVALEDPDIQRWRAPRPPGDDDGTWRDPKAWLAKRVGFWAEGKHACFIIMDAVTGAVLGDVSIQHIDTHLRTAEVGYWLMPEARGAGVATHGVATASRWAFGALGIHRLTLIHAAPNTASCAVANRTGFALEGVMRDGSVGPDGRHHDEHLHARLATDPPVPAA
ncbi:GNAT family N-acetyltransferase [Yinghuangia soli]|uniref:GNAT family N-acetyltransferase n=1 Tax=Yinghuangia soli TaxID=2908204 RepID=A0AA41Q9U3_9ACTN|nr:GNAT family N-acetyltransferase [Yinghuangia soli]MCF2533917.1 GNAT family N-acetyltransferase [Yinghuangia soli]